jgi:hypothetical protein
MRTLFFTLLLLIFSVSCKKESDINAKQNLEIKTDTTLLKIKTTLAVKLNSQAKKIVSNWEEYQNINEFIPNFYNTDTKQSLFDSQRILELSQQLKDSIRIEKFDIPSFRARLHVLYNESLRLADMDSIKSITQKEVVLQTNNIVNAFDAINSKINVLVSKENLENNLKEFDSILNKKDSTKKEFNPFIKPRLKNKKRTIKPINSIKNRRKIRYRENKQILDKLKKIKKTQGE